MGHRFAEIAFTESVRKVQQEQGSRANYANMEGGEDYNYLLSENEAGFIEERDSFYMASVSETGWPYVQHRGGPRGFMRVLDEKTIGFADFSGNRQYVSVGNFQKDDRVSLFFMDYVNQRRLKLMGRVRVIGMDDQELLSRLEIDAYRAQVERGFLISVEAFDWNCPQHITPRYTEQDIKQRMLTSATVQTDYKPKTLGEGPLELVITGIRQLTSRIRSYELHRADGTRLPQFDPGAHLQIPVLLQDGSSAIRSYSISSDPARRDHYQIVVLRDEEGRGGSRAVHEAFTLGMHLHCGLPQNDFPLQEESAPVILIAGGIGITPIKSMAHTLKQRGKSFQLHYAGRSREDMAFLPELQLEFGASLEVHVSAEDQRLNIEQLLNDSPEDSIIYVCGPERLITAIQETANQLGIDAERIRYERFAAPDTTNNKPLELTLQRSGKHLSVAADESILDALLDAGIDAPYNCKAGNCKTCAVRVTDGEPEHRDTALTPEERDKAQLMCPCVSRARTDSLTLDL